MIYLYIFIIGCMLPDFYYKCEIAFSYIIICKITQYHQHPLRRTIKALSTFLSVQ